jgi:putative transposase
MLSVVADETARGELRGDLDELAREGARRMLAATLEAEVDDYLAAHAAERDEAGRRLVVRNGHARERAVTTAAGAIPVARRGWTIAGSIRRPAGVPLPLGDPAARCRKSPKVAEVLPLLYLHGLSTGDFVPALEQFFAPRRGCRRRPWADCLLPGRPTTRRSVAATWPTVTTCTSGRTGCTSGCGWSRLGCAVW